MESEGGVITDDNCFRLLEVRSRLYELLTHCIPPEIILKVCNCVIRINGDMS